MLFHGQLKATCRIAFRVRYELGPAPTAPFGHSGRAGSGPLLFSFREWWNPNHCSVLGLSRRSIDAIMRGPANQSLPARTNLPRPHSAGAFLLVPVYLESCIT
jgi:hypothetical protein